MGSDPTLTDDTEVAGFLADVHATYVSEPEEVVASRHLAAMAREAELVLPRRAREPAGWTTIMNRNRFIRPAVTLGAATLAAVLGAAGLAVAGMDLPDPATKAFERAGITLPNQAGGGQSGEHSRSDEVHSVLEATPPSERGCAFGHSVAEAAKGSPLPEQAQGACDKANENGDAAKSPNSSHSDFGRNTAERAKGQKDATVEERRSFGEETSGQARELGGGPDANRGADQRGDTAAGDTPAGDTTGAPEGTPSGPPEGTPNGPPDTAPVPDGTPTGPPEGTPNGRP
jgi:hypothetical protein